MAQNKKKTPQKTASGKKAGDSRRQEPERSFNGRVTAGVILIILGIITAIGYFLDKSEGGKLVGLLCGLFKGLMGWGFYILPPALIVGGTMLLVRHNKPKAIFRTVSALLIPVLFGSIIHLILCSAKLSSGFTAFKELWISGRALESGGVISGGFALALVYLLTKVGAYIIIILMMLFFIFASINAQLGSVVSAFKAKAEDSKQARADRKLQEKEAAKALPPEPEK